MTREEREIIEAIKSMGYDRTAYPKDKVSAVISMAIEALKAQEWIPCSERLPYKEGEYIVTLDGEFEGNDSVMFAPLDMEDQDNPCFGYYSNIYQEFIEIPVLAWMKIPEPYKAESEDKE